MSKEARDTISEELGVQPIMINAALVGAQNRKRYFWTNIEGVTLPKDRGVYLKDVLEENVSEIYNVPVNVDGSEKVKSNTIRASGRSIGYGDRHNWDTIRVATLNKGGQGDRIYSIEGKSVCLSAHGGGRGAKT
jgi:DNA (cytosine-5)-methyltransferase 3A